MAFIERQIVEVGQRVYTVRIWQIEANEPVPNSGRDAAGYETSEAGRFVALISDEEDKLRQELIAPYASIHNDISSAMDEAVEAIREAEEYYDE